MRIAVTLLLMLLMLSTVGCGGPETPSDPLEKIHAEFRAEMEKVLPADYDSIDINKKQKEFMTIAKRVYGPHAAELRKEAIRLLAKLPAFDPAAMEGFGEPLSHEIPPNMAGLPAEVLYIAKAWDPSAAALMMKKLTLPRWASSKEVGARLLYERLVPDKAYRAGGTDAEPSIAIKSLQDIIIVKLSLQDSGCYAPKGVKWYGKKK
jgi:hypothetical protein